MAILNNSLNAVSVRDFHEKNATRPKHPGHAGHDHGGVRNMFDYIVACNNVERTQKCGIHLQKVALDDACIGQVNAVGFAECRQMLLKFYTCRTKASGGKFANEATIATATSRYAAPTPKCGATSKIKSATDLALSTHDIAKSM